MSIEKISNVGGFDRLIKENIPYTVIPNDVYRSLPDMETKALWVELLMLPNDWKINKVHLRSILAIGQNKLDKLFSNLVKAKLLVIHKIRDQSGVFVRTDYEVKFFPSTTMETMGMETIGMDMSDYKVKENTKQNINTNGQKNLAEDELLFFKEFWNLYDKKVKPDRAKKIWTKNKLWEKWDDIKANLLLRQKHEQNWVKCSKQQKQYIPHPDQYLKNKGWEDELLMTHKNCKCKTQKDSLSRSNLTLGAR